MVKCIVIPHDMASPPQLRELADIDEFQESVGGWLELLELPAISVTLFVNEAVRRNPAPVNTRAMALWWLHSATPSDYPILLGDVVLAGAGTTDRNGNVPERVIRRIFARQEFVVQARPGATAPWADTLARFDNVFDAATWLTVFNHAVRPTGQFRLRARSLATGHATDAIHGQDASW